MKHFTILFFFCILSFTSNAQSWQYAVKATSTTYNIPVRMVADSIGNLYVIGKFQGPTIKFGNLPVLYNNSIGANKYDFYIVKYDPFGTALWSLSGGGHDYDYLLDIALDKKSNLYVTGYFTDTATFGSTTMIAMGASGDRDLFYSKITTDGNIIWVKKAGGLLFDSGDAITCDKSGSFYIAGQSQGITFSNGFAIPVCGFVAKFDTAGNPQWERHGFTVGGPIGINAWMSSIGSDDFGNIFMQGEFFGDTLFFETDTLINYESITTDMFVVKYDTSGDFQWSRYVSGGGYQSGGNRNSWVDRNGNYLVLLSTPSNIIYPFNFQLNSTPTDLILKYKADGTFLWFGDIGGLSFPYTEKAWAVITDSSNNIYITGNIDNQFSYNDTSITGLTPHLYVLKLDSMGVFQSVISTNAEEGKAIAIDSYQNIYVGDANLTTCSFGSINLPASTNYCSAIAKYGFLPPVPVVSASLSDSVICADECIQFSASSTVPVASWNWSFPGGTPSSSNLQNPIVCYHTAGTYTNARVIASNPGGIDTTFITTPINVIALPTVSITAPDSVCINAGIVTLSGLPAGGVYSGNAVTGSTFNPLTAGIGNHTVYYNYTDAGTGCSNSDSATISVQNCTAVSKLQGSNAFLLYPNPASSSFTIQSYLIQNFQIEMTDITGRVVLTIETTPGKEIDISNLDNGVYFVKIISKETIISARLLKQP